MSLFNKKRELPSRDHMERDFIKVIKVIKSCTKLEHLEMAYNIFQNFLKFYYDNDISGYCKYSKEFRKCKRETIQSFGEVYDTSSQV